MSRPTSLACDKCRSKHLRCDGRQPICSRCELYGESCVFIPSRRGMRPKKSTRLRGSGSVRQSEQNGGTSRESWQTPDSAISGHVPYPSPLGTLDMTSGTTSDSPHVSTQTYDVDHNASVEEHLIDHYYTSFHASHPILPPRQPQAWRHYPRSLKLSMQLVGSHYCSAASVPFWSDTVKRYLETHDGETLYDVQAYLLHSMISQADNDPSSAQASLSTAVVLALSLGLDRAGYHTANAAGAVSAAHCSVRTWWQLLEIDALMAAVTGKLPLLKSPPDPLMPLPMEVEATSSDVSEDALQSHSSFADLECHAFNSDDAPCLPTSASRIEAVMLLRRILADVAKPDAGVDEVQSLDYQLAAWTHHLPPKRREILSTCGTTDYMLLQAQLIVNLSTIILHFPRSDLVQRNLVPTSSGLACARNNSVPVYSYAVHAVNAVSASKAICDLAALRLPTHKLSPVFVCGFTLAAMVQLAAARNHHGSECLGQYRSRVMLNLGVLKSLAELYDIARRAEEQLRPLARNIFHPSAQVVEQQPCGQANDSLDFSNFFMDDLWAWNLFNTSVLPSADNLDGLASD